MGTSLPLNISFVKEFCSQRLSREVDFPKRPTPPTTAIYSEQDGSAALPANSIKLPDDWVWAHEWKIDGSGGRDTGGWEYGKDLIKFNVSRGGRRALDRVP